MAYYKNKYRTDSNRWRYWNYSAPGSYFLTACIFQKQEILGKIENGKMILSDEGRIVEKHILQIPEYNNRIIFDEWIIMPNHIHFLLTLGNYQFENGISQVDTKSVDLQLEKDHEEVLSKLNIKPLEKAELKLYMKLRRKMLIPKIMGKFQTLTSIDINVLDKMPGRRNWQYNYHDHVIRAEPVFFKIKNYIRNNPATWEADKFFGKH